MGFKKFIGRKKTEIGRAIKERRTSSDIRKAFRKQERAKTKFAEEKAFQEERRKVKIEKAKSRARTGHFSGFTSLMQPERPAPVRRAPTRRKKKSKKRRAPTRARAPPQPRSIMDIGGPF